MKIFSKVLVENHELADAQSGKQKGNGEPGGVDGEQQNAASDGLAVCRKNEHGTKDRADTRSPAESECEAEEEAAPYARLRSFGAKMDVAIEPARHRRAEEADRGKREKMYC